VRRKGREVIEGEQGKQEGEGEDLRPLHSPKQGGNRNGRLKAARSPLLRRAEKERKGDRGDVRACRGNAGSVE
jgi:hypothetical protein